MPMSIDSLSKSDYDILSYINQYDHVSKEQIIRHFNGKIYAIEHRLEILSKPEHSKNLKCSLPDSNYLYQDYEDISRPGYQPDPVYKGTYHITDVGRKALDDYRMKNKVERRKTWLNRLWGFLSGVAITILAELILLWVSKWL